MPLFGSPFAMLSPYSACHGYGALLGAAPPARTVGPVADDAEHVRPERRIDAVDTNRPDYDVVPDHDPDGTPWAA